MRIQTIDDLNREWLRTGKPEAHRNLLLACESFCLCHMDRLRAIADRIKLQQDLLLEHSNLTNKKFEADGPGLTEQEDKRLQDVRYVLDQLDDTIIYPPGFFP